MRDAGTANDVRAESAEFGRRGRQGFDIRPTCDERMLDRQFSVGEGLESGDVEGERGDREQGVVGRDTEYGAHGGEEVGQSRMGTITPCGRPVEPDAYMTYARSSGPIWAARFSERP
jgi:hypothetical protein